MLFQLFTRRLVALMAVVAVCASSPVYGSKNTKTYGPNSFAVGRVYELKVVTTWTGYTGTSWVINPSTDPEIPMTRFMVTVPMPGGPSYAYVMHEHIFVTTFANAAAITGANTVGSAQENFNILWDPSTIVP